MKTEKEIKRALELMEMVIHGDINVKPPIPEDVLESIRGCRHALNWILGRAGGEAVRVLLLKAEAQMEAPDHNPQTSLSA